jgi:LCP family protein required for cell wall assembly
VPFLVLMLVVAGAGAAGMLAAARSTIDSVARIEGLSPVLDAPSSTVDNYLLIGSDSRAGADPTAPDFGGIGSETDVGGSRSDTIMVLRHDRASGTVSLLSVPRDLWVDIPGRGSNRINSAYRDGPAAVVQTVQANLGIPVHHYIEIDFSGFKSLVEALGGVEMCFMFPTRDVHTGLNIVEPGCFMLDGVQSLAYARSRHYEEYRDGEWHEDGTADLGRIERQQQFVDTALKAALTGVLSNPFTVGEVVRSSAGSVSIDDELDLVETAAALRPAASSGLQTYSLPVVGTTIDGKSVLLLGNGADALLAFFRGEVPLPPPVG